LTTYDLALEEEKLITPGVQTYPTRLLISINSTQRSANKVLCFPSQVFQVKNNGNSKYSQRVYIVAWVKQIKKKKSISLTVDG
jgi:hypothetical protein